MAALKRDRESLNAPMCLTINFLRAQIEINVFQVSQYLST